MKVAPFIPRANATLADAVTWIRQVTAALTNGVTLAENLAGEVKSLTWNSDAPPTIATKARPIAVLLLSASLLSTPSTRISGAVVTWTQTTAGVVVTAIEGLTPSTDYAVSLWLVGG